MNKVTLDPRKYYMSEYYHFDGDHRVTFNIIVLDLDRREVTVNISDLGRLSVQTFPLMGAESNPYFQYGLFDENDIYIDEFVQITEVA